MSHAARTAALALLVHLACIPSIVVGDAPQDSSTTAAPDLTTGGATGSDTPTTTTSGEPLPGVCGDGVVDLGEVCDDGNDEPNDGCDAACARTGRVVWTFEPEGRFSIADIAFAPNGLLLVSGFDVEPRLLALSPGGEELWRKTVPGVGELAVDPAGRIFIGAGEFVHAFSPDLKQLWSADPAEEAELAGVIGLDVRGDGVYVGSLEGSDQRLVVRRHDIVTGAVSWETRTPEGFTLLAEDLAVVDDRAYVVGQVNDTEGVTRPLLAAFDAESGALLSLELDDPVVRPWIGAAAIGDGDLVIAGAGLDADVALRRFDPALAERWTTLTVDDLSTIPARMAVGPGERIAVVGRFLPDERPAHVHLYDGAGARLWLSKFEHQPGEWGNAVATAFGPDFLAVAGVVHSGDEDAPFTRAWIRRFAVDE
ncbi:outer membrane protein assembly factor BamB family protein [Nannocystis punicea]|uniref:PQQ-binding-like beta-propeller repeat protein n=1 Tax=Nannocystis punicea TaxID=2995304 RepID=A0ABY7HF68_9BACT|nr:PQQ-binding-like beta-propeller repeat protein [Nannocystis poenicansa]WAS97918.1 PQQ-binding-like beta-propeller repeat protein [Nannocystis poenicansa]